MPKEEQVYLEPNNRYSVNPSYELETAVNEMFGPGAFHIAADKTLPERAPKKWERRNDE